MKDPKNQHQLVIWYLYHWASFSMKELVIDSYFYKFPARLSEIEQEHGQIAERSKRKFVNRFGRKSTYFEYNSSISKEKLLELFAEYE